VTRLGATKVVRHEPRLAVVEELAAWSGGILHSPFDGLPVAHPGGIDVVYDTIAKPETFEVGVRVLAEHGTLVQIGVATPGRWEWTPIYFKELTIAGSNAFGIEEVEGVRQHAIAHYLDLAAAGRIDLTGMLTHRFPLERWWDALGALARQDESGAIKVAFEPQATGRS
jgi:threonine dehydrogenase-like Zn-dependent dehydrogenase